MDLNNTSTIRKINNNNNKKLINVSIKSLFPIAERYCISTLLFTSLRISYETGLLVPYKNYIYRYIWTSLKPFYPLLFYVILFICLILCALCCTSRLLSYNFSLFYCHQFSFLLLSFQTGKKIWVQKNFIFLFNWIKE